MIRDHTFQALGNPALWQDFGLWKEQLCFTCYVIQQESIAPAFVETQEGVLTTTVEPETEEIVPSEVAAPPPITYTSGSLTAPVLSGAAPLVVNFSGRIAVPSGQRGSAVMFFGDGVSEVVLRKGPDLFADEWSYTYTKPGEYDAYLVLTTVSNIDTDIKVMRDPNYFKNLVVRKVRVSVSSPAQSQTVTSDSNSAPARDVLVYYFDGSTYQNTEVTVEATSQITDATLRLLFQTYLPNLTSEYVGVSVLNGVATVNFKSGARAFLDLAPAAGISAEYTNSIRQTLLQFDTIDTVQFAIEGRVITNWGA